MASFCYDDVPLIAPSKLHRAMHIVDAHLVQPKSCASYSTTVVSLVDHQNVIFLNLLVLDKIQYGGPKTEGNIGSFTELTLVGGTRRLLRTAVRQLIASVTRASIALRPYCDMSQWETPFP